MKQVDDLGRVRCADCGKLDNLTDWIIDGGKVIVVCISCRDKRENNS